VHLYIHVPFCGRRCCYCDFAIAVRRNTPSAEFEALLLREWAAAQARSPWTESVELATLYLGGGTPSRLDPGVLARLLAQITEDRPLAPRAEVTLEANPEDVNPLAARAWREAGVNRISLGVQSFDAAVLRWMHRSHSIADPARAVAVLRDAGLTNFSLDLIFALPDGLDRDWRRDLDQALGLEPRHLSLYGLTVESHTPLGRWVERRETRPAPDPRYAEEFLLAHQRLGAAGFEHYEVSSYARPGLRSRHNQAYWHRAPYVGLGPSAHSGVGRHRWWNIREYAAWTRAVMETGLSVAGEEYLEPGALALEQLYLGLRTSEGVPEGDLAAPIRERWIESGWAAAGAGRVCLTPEGWLRLDALVASA
jgi:oxygen-independent coproporphyrinogen-3 oxidase